jgi:hypothetical protein
MPQSRAGVAAPSPEALQLTEQAARNGQAPDPGARRYTFISGGGFILDAPTTVPAVWGEGSDVLWSQGEPLFITGPQGVGKSTIAQQLALARAGVIGPAVIGFPVAIDPRPVLYLASDRPKQIGRSMRRMVREQHRELLDQRICIWPGPLPFDLVKEPLRFAGFVQSSGAGTVVIDSLKDIAGKLSDEETGTAVNRALGAVVALDIEVVVIHHHRKAGTENRKPTKLSDVYGSTWLTGGSGSVVCLWGEPGDETVELTHLKQPSETVGPLDLQHDHEAGMTHRLERPDVWSVLQSALTPGVTAHEAADQLHGSAHGRSDLEKVRRRLEKYVKAGTAVRVKGEQATDPVRYRPVAKGAS